MNNRIGGLISLIVLTSFASSMPTRAAHATASSDDLIKPFVGVATAYDSNLLRSFRSNGVDNRGQSDVITQVRAGFDMDWQLSRQHFIVKANINQNWFQTYDELDYLGWDTLAQWNWQIGNNLNGGIGYSNQRVLGAFTQLNTLIDNLLIQERYFANGAYLFHPSWQVRTGYTHNNWNFNDATRQVSNQIEDTGELSLQFLSPVSDELRSIRSTLNSFNYDLSTVNTNPNPVNNTVGVRVSLTGGRYPNRELNSAENLDKGYIRTQYELIWNWIVSGKTYLDGQFGYTQQEFDHLGRLDFSGITARGNFRWLMSEKTNFLLSGWREIQQVSTLSSNFILSYGIKLTPSWKATQKLQLSLPATYEHQEYLGNSNPPGVSAETDIPPKNDVWNIGLNLAYLPLENIRVALLMQYEERNSNIELRSYQTEYVGLDLQVVF